MVGKKVLGSNLYYYSHGIIENLYKFNHTSKIIKINNT